MLNVLQAEIAKDLLNNNDATIQGILLAVIAILLLAIGILWKSKMEDVKYIREQEKSNLELYMNITKTMDDISKSSDRQGLKLEALHEKAVTILNIIQERLNVK